MGKYSTPVQDFVQRLSFHAAPATPPRLLTGYRWELENGLAVPTESTAGYSDMPAIRLYLPSIRDTFRPARFVDGTLEIKLHIAAARQEGIVNWIKRVETVMDALQYKPQAQRETAALAGTLRHFDWSMTDNFIAGNSLIAQIIVTAHPAARSVGGRRT